jgi:photosystem II stability/assembly factor-like uncharacterized protein
MKKMFVFIPVILLVVSFQNSLTLKENRVEDKKTEEATSSAVVAFQNELFTNPFAKVSGVKEVRKSNSVNLVLQSDNGGQTWRDVSKALPETDQPVDFFAGESGLYLNVKNAVYSSKSNLKAPFWEKENVPALQSSHSRPSTSIAFNSSGVMAFNDKGQIYRKTSLALTWLPILTNFRKQWMRTVFESSDGAVFLGYDHGLYKSDDKGKNWRQVQKGLVMNMVESEGVLMATGGNGIMRSTDKGEHWQWVISEGGVGIAVERIDGGFAAITYNTGTKSRRMRISLDRGKTWQAIDEGLPASPLISSIKQTGKYLICGHPDGIFRSSDRGKTWNRVHSGIGKKIFRMSVSGNSLYAVAASAGC